MLPGRKPSHKVIQAPPISQILKTQNASRPKKNKPPFLPAISRVKEKITIFVPAFCGWHPTVIT